MKEFRTKKQELFAEKFKIIADEFKDSVPDKKMKRFRNMNNSLMNRTQIIYDVKSKLHASKQF